MDVASLDLTFGAAIGLVLWVCLVLVDLIT